MTPRSRGTTDAPDDASSNRFRRGRRNSNTRSPRSRRIPAGTAPDTRTPPRSRKEVFQPHLPVRLPCYDLAPVTCLTLGRSLRSRTSGTPSFHGLTGGVYKARERIHRAMADARLLANPASRSTETGFRDPLGVAAWLPSVAPPL